MHLLSRCSGTRVGTAIALVSPYVAVQPRPRPSTRVAVTVAVNFHLPWRTQAPARLLSAVPSTCRSPTARALVAGPRRDRRPASQISAHEGPCGSPPAGRRDGATAIPESWLPAEGKHFGVNARTRKAPDRRWPSVPVSVLCSAVPCNLVPDVLLPSCCHFVRKIPGFQQPGNRTAASRLPPVAAAERRRQAKPQPFGFRVQKSTELLSLSMQR
jgi:hypothetical protein